MISFSGCPDDPDPGQYHGLASLNVRIAERTGYEIESGVRHQIDPDCIRMRPEHLRFSLCGGHNGSAPQIRNMVIRRSGHYRKRTLLFTLFRHVDIVPADIEADLLFFSGKSDAFQRNDQIRPPAVLFGKHVFPDSRKSLYRSSGCGKQKTAFRDRDLIILIGMIRFQENLEIIIGKQTAFHRAVRTEFRFETGPKADIQIRIVIEHLGRSRAEFRPGVFRIDQPADTVRISRPDGRICRTFRGKRDNRGFSDLHHCVGTNSGDLQQSRNQKQEQFYMLHIDLCLSKNAQRIW